MAFITFYGAANSDIDQLSAGLMGTDHHWEYVSGPATLANLKADCEVISVTCKNPIGADIMAALPKLRLIAVRCSDYDKIDIAAAADRNITVVNVPETVAVGSANINAVTDDSIVSFWYGKSPHKVAMPSTHFGRLVIVRHGQSEWDKTGEWLGSTDAHLSEEGQQEAIALGNSISDIEIGHACTSEQQRTMETLEVMLNTMRQLNVPYVQTSAFNERNLGAYTDQNEQQLLGKLGQDGILHLFRDWDYDVPGGGETLKHVFERAVPYLVESIIPLLKTGSNVLIVTHSSVIRTLVKHIERVSDVGLAHVEIPAGEILLYSITEDGHMVTKDVRKINAHH